MSHNETSIVTFNFLAQSPIRLLSVLDDRALLYKGSVVAFGGTSVVKARTQQSLAYCSILTTTLLASVCLLTYSHPARAQFTGTPTEFVPGEILVKLKGSSKTTSAQAFIGKAVSEKSMTLKGSFSSINLHYFSLKPGQKVEDALNDLKSDPTVEFAEPNYIYHRQSAGVEGQPVAMDTVNAESANDVSAYSQTSAPIELQQAWAAETLGRAAPIVAVIDTGIDSTHPVFTSTGAVWTNPNEIAGNLIDDDSNGYIDDVHGWNFVANTNSPYDDDGHGTHVSGIILGTTQDITASNLQPAAIRIMPLKFLDSTGSGSTSDAVRAIYYAVNNGAKVLSNSWGGGGYSDSLLAAMAFAYDHHVIFVAAAGNAAANNDASPTYPANYNVPNVISVAATSDLDGLASFSNFGATTVHMGSPGVSIFSTLPGGYWGRESGTSMATPFVSGLAALMVRETPGITGYQVKNLIFGALNPISSLNGKATTQSRLNVYNGIMAAKGVSVNSSQPSYSTSSMRDPSSDATAGAAAGCGLVKSMMNDEGGGGPSGPGNNVAFFALLIVLSSPVIISLVLRQKSGAGQRRNPRYQINSEVRVKFGDRELVGQVSTISLGGVQLNTEEWLEKGGIVAMSIRSPDGRDEIQVEGKIVWSEEGKRYGVQFANAGDGALSVIGRWTQGLLKA